MKLKSVRKCFINLGKGFIMMPSSFCLGFREFRTLPSTQLSSLPLSWFLSWSNTLLFLSSFQHSVLSLLAMHSLLCSPLYLQCFVERREVKIICSFLQTICFFAGVLPGKGHFNPFLWEPPPNKTKQRVLWTKKLRNIIYFNCLFWGSSRSISRVKSKKS